MRFYQSLILEPVPVVCFFHWLRELPNAFGIGIDRSAGALAVAQENARRLQLEDRAQFYVSDWFSNVSKTRRYPYCQSALYRG